MTIILKPVPGAKRWQHLQRQQGPAGGEHLAVEENYTVILGSHRNSKLKIEKNGDEKASVGLVVSLWVSADYQTATVLKIAVQLCHTSIVVHPVYIIAWELLT